MHINRVVLTGNLTKDPELKGSGQVCALRLAVNTRRRNGQSGEWQDQPNYFDVTVFGAQAENCQRYLRKGRAVAVDGRLRWCEWTTQDGQRRQAVDVVAEAVQFLGGRDQASGTDSRAPEGSPQGADAFARVGFDATAASTGVATEDDIPF